jgi:hypothetical protein
MERDSRCTESQPKPNNPNTSNTMNESEMFNILRTCIIGEAYQACGIGFDPEDNLDVYHLDDLKENADPDEWTGSYSSPDAFLETECGSNAGRIYETIYLMEASWRLGKSSFHKEWQLPIGSKLWDMGKGVAMQYLSSHGEDDDLRLFVDRGEAVFRPSS